MKTISIISPCFNEEESVENCYRVVRDLFAAHLPGYRPEHIFVDNASTDRTVEILKQIARNDPNVKIIVNSRNFGIFRSSFNALKYATGNAIVVMLPVDLQDPPEHIPEFVRLWEQGYEVVAGARANREEPLAMRTARGIFYRIVSALSDFEILPNVGEFQLIDRKVLNAVLAHNDHYPYIRGIIASCGFRRVVVPYVWKARKSGAPKHNHLMRIDQALNAIFAFTRAPMRFCTLAGLAISMICILFSFISVILFFVQSVYVPRGTTTIIVALFFLSGIQLIFIGMLGEYVTSIHYQVRGGPLVIERERINIDNASNPSSAFSNEPADQRAAPS